MLQLIVCSYHIYNKYSNFSWLPNNDDLQNAMDSMVGNAYLYGRNYIAAKVTGI